VKDENDLQPIQSFPSSFSHFSGAPVYTEPGKRGDVI